MVSALLGGGAMFFALSAIDRVPRSSADVLDPAGSERQPELLDMGDSPIVGARLSVYHAVSALGNVAEIESEIDRIMSLRPSRRADIELEALLLRFLELDPRGAIRFARNRGLDSPLLVRMFQSWMAFDSTAALETLETIEPASLVRAITLALVGSNREDIERLGQLLAEEDRAGFRSDALARLAESDPESAFDGALELNDQALRIRTARGVASGWARRNPLAALSRVSEITHDARLRNRFDTLIVAEWARVDPDAALEYLTSPSGQKLFTLNTRKAIHSIINALAVRRPHEALAAADKLPADARAALRSTALKTIVEQDLNAAVARADGMPVGIEREELLQIVTESYARRDPSRALAWAERIEASRPGTTQAVLMQVALGDLPRAVDAALKVPNGVEMLARAMSPRQPPAGTPITMNVDTLGEVADKLAAAGESGSRAMNNLLQAWPALDPDAALTWLLEEGSAVDQTHIENLAKGFANGDLVLSTQLVDSWPVESRGAWISQVAGVYALTDRDAALAWLAPYQGQPGYDASISTAAASIAARDAESAAALLDTAQAPTTEASSRVATTWARDDPRAAADWALSLNDAPARSAGVAAAVRTWSSDDPAAARRWSLGLPRGRARDDALAMVLARDIARGAVEGDIESAFSSDSAWRRALDASTAAFLQLAANDPARATELVRLHFDEDSSLRLRIEEEIDGASSQPGR